MCAVQISTEVVCLAEREMPQGDVHKDKRKDGMQGALFQKGFFHFFSCLPSLLAVVLISVL